MEEMLNVRHGIWVSKRDSEGIFPALFRDEK